MRIEKVSSNGQVQKLVMEIADGINSSDRLAKAANYYQKFPFYTLLKDGLYEPLYNIVKELATRLALNGTMGDAVINLLFHDDFEKEPEKYIRYIIEDAIDKIFKRKIGQPETKFLDLCLRNTDGTSFRAFFHRIIYVTGTKQIKQFVSSVIGHPEDDGVIAYGYIDKQAGLSYKAICSAHIENNQIVCGEISKVASFTIRANSMKGTRYIDLLNTNVDMYEFESTVEMTRLYDTENKDVEMMRNNTDLDPSRHPEYPDDIFLYLVDNGHLAERIWIRCCKLDYDTKLMYGTLLNEPNLKCGYHIGETIGFRVLNDAEGNPICVHLDSY